MIRVHRLTRTFEDRDTGESPVYYMATDVPGDRAAFSIAAVDGSRVLTIYRGSGNSQAIAEFTDAVGWEQTG